LIAWILAVRLMCANGYLSWLLMCIGDTLYVCSHIILLSTPTITDVTKIAHREGVPNGALPKSGWVLTPLWGKATLPSTKERSHLPRMCIFVPSTVMRICCYRELFLLQTQRIIGQARYILKIIFISLEILFIIHSHSVWLSCKHVTQVYRNVCMIIEIIFHHSQSLCVAGLQWRMIIALVAGLQWRMIIALAAAITLGDWLLNMCGPSSSLWLTFLLFLCYVYIHHYCSPSPAVISVIRIVIECWYTEK